MKSIGHFLLAPFVNEDTVEDYIERSKMQINEPGGEKFHVMFIPGLSDGKVQFPYSTYLLRT